MIAWDLDGTLVDPQPRMLATVRAFGVVDAPLRAMRPTWQQTAEALDLDLHAFRGGAHPKAIDLDQLLRRAARLVPRPSHRRAL